LTAPAVSDGSARATWVSSVIDWAWPERSSHSTSTRSDLCPWAPIVVTLRRSVYCVLVVYPVTASDVVPASGMSS